MNSGFVEYKKLKIGLLQEEIHLPNMDFQGFLLLVSGIRLSGVFCQAFANCFVCFSSPWESQDLSCNSHQHNAPYCGLFRLVSPLPVWEHTKSDGVWKTSEVGMSFGCSFRWWDLFCQSQGHWGKCFFQQWLQFSKMCWLKPEEVAPNCSLFMVPDFR